MDITTCQTEPSIDGYFSFVHYKESDKTNKLKVIPCGRAVCQTKIGKSHSCFFIRTTCT